MANCPECGAVLGIDADEVEEGELLTCPECDVELEVVNTKPLEFDVIEEEEDEEEKGNHKVSLESDDEEPEKDEEEKD